MGINPESEMKVKDLVVLILWVRRQHCLRRVGWESVEERWQHRDWPGTEGAALQPSEGFFGGT